MTLYIVYYQEYGENKSELIAHDTLPTEYQAWLYLKELNEADIELADIEGVYKAVGYTLKGQKEITIKVTPLEATA